MSTCWTAMLVVGTHSAQTFSVCDQPPEPSTIQPSRRPALGCPVVQSIRPGNDPATSNSLAWPIDCTPPACTPPAMAVYFLEVVSSSAQATVRSPAPPFT